SRNKTASGTTNGEHLVKHFSRAIAITCQANHQGPQTKGNGALASRDGNFLHGSRGVGEVAAGLVKNSQVQVWQVMSFGKELEGSPQGCFRLVVFTGDSLHQGQITPQVSSVVGRMGHGLSQNTETFVVSKLRGEERNVPGVVLGFG